MRFISNETLVFAPCIIGIVIIFYYIIINIATLRKPSLNLGHKTLNEMTFKLLPFPKTLLLQSKRTK